MRGFFLWFGEGVVGVEGEGFEGEMDLRGAMVIVLAVGLCDGGFWEMLIGGGVELLFIFFFLLLLSDAEEYEGLDVVGVEEV